MATCTDAPVVLATPNAPDPEEDSMTVALLARVPPAVKLMAVAAVGALLPGKTLRCPVAPGVMVVRLTARALAAAGMPHWPAATKTRCPGRMAGPPYAPGMMRVSTSRQGVRV